MKRIYSAIIFTVLILMLTGCPGKTVVTKVEPNQPIRSPGLIYNLPKTVVVVDVPVTCTEVKDGGLYSYWDRAFGAIYLRPELKTTCKLGDITISTLSTHDLTEIYKLELEAGLMKEASGTFSYDEAGNMTGFKASSQDKAVETSIEVLKFGAKLLTIGMAKAVSTATGRKSCAQLHSRYVLSKKECAEAYYKCLEAEELGKQIGSLTGWRDKVLAGTYKTDNPETTMNFINAQLESIMKKFIKSKETTKTWRLKYIPQVKKKNDYGTPPVKENISKLIFNFNEKVSPLGLQACADNDIQHPPDLPEIDWCDHQDGNAAMLIIEPLETISDKIVYKAQANSPCCPGEKGLRYRMPGRARVVLKAGAREGHKIMAHSEVVVAQFGNILWLPADLGGLGIEQDISIYPATGALKMVTLTSKGIDPSKISDVSGAVTPLVEKLTQEKSDEEKELDQLKTKAEKLKLQVEIMENKEKLGVE